MYVSASDGTKGVISCAYATADFACTFSADMPIYLRDLMTFTTQINMIFASPTPT